MNFTTSISPWSWSHSTSLFWAFFHGMVYIFIIQKISPEWGRLQLFFNSCRNFAVILPNYPISTSSDFFLHKIWVITNSNHAANITLLGLLNEKQLCTFVRFLHIWKPHWPPSPIVHCIERSLQCFSVLQRSVALQLIAMQFSMWVALQYRWCILGTYVGLQFVRCTAVQMMHSRNICWDFLLLGPFF